MFMCGGFFLLFFLAQHTHAAMHISRPKARTPITTPARMTPTCADPLLLLLPLLLRLLLLSESPPLRFGAGCDGESLDGAAGEPLAAGAGGGNALLFCGAGGGDTDGVGGNGDGGGEPEPGRRARAAEHQALDEHLAHQPPAARPERRAEGDLALAPERPHEEEAGDVRAGDEEDQGDGAGEGEDGGATPAHQPLLERHDARPDARTGRDPLPRIRLAAPVGRLPGTAAPVTAAGPVRRSGAAPGAVGRRRRSGRRSRLAGLRPVVRGYPLARRPAPRLNRIWQSKHPKPAKRPSPTH